MISIVIPTWNEEKAIGRTLQNLQEGLKRIPHEIIVADDGSTDKTRAIARRYGVIIAGAKNKSNIPTGKNRGAKLARGEYIVFLDADVTMKDPATFFRKAVKHFEDNPRLVGLGCFIRIVPETETKSDIFFRSLFNYFNLFVNNVLHLGTGPGEFQMVRRHSFKKIGGFDVTLSAGEDNDLFARLSRIGETRFDKTLVVYEQGRRAHQVGWLKLYTIWILNGTMVALFKRPLTKEWKEIR